VNTNVSNLGCGLTIRANNHLKTRAENASGGGRSHIRNSTLLFPAIPKECSLLLRSGEQLPTS
jgi:hypothetical protein